MLEQAGKQPALTPEIELITLVLCIYNSNAGQKSAEGRFLSKLVYKFCPSQKLVHLSGCFKVQTSHMGQSTSQK